MSHYLLFNGKMQRDDLPLISADNRGFRYGDGLFETMKVVEDAILLGQYHFDRLFKGLALLRFELPAYFTAEWLSTQIATLCRKNNHPVARVRLAVFRGNGGLYDPENHFPNFIIQSWALSHANPPLNVNGLVLGICPDVQKAMDIFSNLKSSNYLPYVMAALHAKNKQWNDALVLNAQGRVCDSSIANVFIVSVNDIITPSLSEGGIEGVMRRFLLDRLPALGFSVQEGQLTLEEIMKADEIFLTNAVQGIRWVKQCDNTSYGHQRITAIHNALYQKNR